MIELTFGPLPRHPQAAQGQPNRFVADQVWGQALGVTDLGSELQGPPARGLTECPWTLMQQRPQGLAGPCIEDGRRGVRARREGLQHCEPTLVEGMNRVAHGLIGAAQVVRNGGGGLALGTGEEDLAAADGKGGRGPESGLQCGPLVRRERAYK